MPQTSCITHTVLIIDPDATARTHLASLLTNRFRVIEAATLDEAAQQIVLHHPRIILIEVDLPGDALTFIRQVRQEPTTQDTCIACVTRRAEVQDKVAGFQAGADDYLVKPYNAATFLARITLLVRVHQLNH